MRGLAAALVITSCAARSSGPAPAVEAEAPPPARYCSTHEPGAVGACVDPSRYRSDVEKIAAPRPPGSRQWRSVQLLCGETFHSLGFEVETHRYKTGINIVGSAPGRSEKTVLVGAHYDHIPGCPGADDNATGVAAVLELARVLAGADLERTIKFACWDEEERGLVGSRAWARAALERGDDIAVYFNFDAIGYTDRAPGSQRVPTGFGLVFGDDVEALEARGNIADFIAVITDESGEPFGKSMAAHASDDLELAVLTVPRLVRVTGIAVDLRRSDHAVFWDHGVPAVMITDTAEFRSSAYHCLERPDAIDTLDFGFATEVVRAAAGAVSQAATGDVVPSHPASVATP